MQLFISCDAAANIAAAGVPALDEVVNLASAALAGVDAIVMACQWDHAAQDDLPG